MNIWKNEKPTEKQLPGWFVTQLVFHLWRYGRHGQGTRNFSKPGSMANSNMLWCRQNIEWNHLAPLGYWSKGYSWSNKWWFKNIGNGTEMETDVTNGNRKSNMFICSSIRWGNSAAPWLQVGKCWELWKKPEIRTARAPGLSLHTSKFSWPTIPAWKVKMIMSIFGKPVETLEFYLGLEGYTRYTR